jgi:hypothetical protein
LARAKRSPKLGMQSRYETHHLKAAHGGMPLKQIID